MKLTILMPCLNEAESLKICIEKAKAWAEESGIECEIVVADNGSADGSQEIARINGARVVNVPIRGYGSALYYGAIEASGEYIIMGDSDNSYDFSQLNAFFEKLDQGFDLVMGNRFLGGIKSGAMPWKNRYIGNPILTWVGRMLFKCPVRDFHCGLRGVRYDAFMRMDLRTVGMEFASEMVIKATLLGMKIAEVPTTLSKDSRSRPPHLQPWRDGWRHLRFMLLLSPRWLFFIPGIIIFFISGFFYLLLLANPVKIGGIIFDIHSLFFAQSGITIGFASVILGIFVKMIGMREGLLQGDSFFEKMRKSPILEFGSATGLLLMFFGIYLAFDLLAKWGSKGFGELHYGSFLRSVSLSSALITLGGIGFLSSMIMGFLALPTRR